MSAGTSGQAQAANAAELAKLTANLAALGTAVRGSAPDALSRIAVTLVNRIKQTLSHPGTGQVYHHGGIDHQASAPGEPPAVDTGRLRASYTWVPGQEAGKHYVDVGTSVEYAPMLEYGTMHMAARPHFRPAVQAEIGSITEQITKQVLAVEQAVIARMVR